MCDHSKDPGGREAAMVEAYPGVWCDPCIAPLVEALNEADLPTAASCCGHGKEPGKIALADGRELFVLPDFESARKFEAAHAEMETLRRFKPKPSGQPPAGEVERQEQPEFAVPDIAECLEEALGGPQFKHDVRVVYCRMLTKQMQEFDAWLSFRGEFSEVLAAFRKAFGTDTRAAALLDSQGDQEPCKRCHGTGWSREGSGFVGKCSPCPDCNPAPPEYLDTLGLALDASMPELLDALEAEWTQDKKRGVDGLRAVNVASLILQEAVRLIRQGDTAEVAKAARELSKLVAQQTPVARHPESYRLAAGASVVLGAAAAVLPFAEIDAEELEQARRAPETQALHAAADQHLETLREEGRIEGGDEEDWPEEVDLWRDRAGAPVQVLPILVFGRHNGEVRRYVPASSQDSSGLEETTASDDEKALLAELHDAEDRASKAEAERDANRADALANLDALEKHRRRAERYENALEELAQELEKRTAQPEAELKGNVLTEVGEWGARAEVKANREAASLVREKAAKLKGGQGDE